MTNELKEYLGVTLEEMESIMSLTDSKVNELPCINIKGKYYFPKKAIDEWLRGLKTVQFN